MTQVAGTELGGPPVPPATGKVYLVGAGPGDPGLLTLRGLECLQEADLVLFDGLVNPLLLEHTRATCERTRRRGEDGRKRLDQDEINRRLVEEARAGRTVVRLKGGDPLVFGRGAEEAVVLAEAGIPFEIVPGITAATAAAAYAGIPMTHRELASSVTLVTGHEDPAKQATAVDYDLLARLSGTLVFYMGLDRIGSIVDSLLDAGKDGSTPAAVISRGTTSAQSTVAAALADLPGEVARVGLVAPSLIVIGECVRQRDAMAWFEDRPLLGQSIGVTRPVSQSAGVAAEMIRMGAEPVLMPTIEIRPPENRAEVDEVIGRIEAFDWIVFSSANGVNGLIGRLWELGGDARALGGCRLAAIGPATADALAAYQLRPDVVPDEFRAEALGAALADQVSGCRVLWARASRGRDVLPRLLTEAGAEVEQVVVYINDDLDAWPSETVDRLKSGSIDWIGLSSPSIARGVARLAASADVSLEAIRLAAISPVTEEAAIEAGLRVSTVASEFTWSGLISAMARVSAASHE